MATTISFSIPTDKQKEATKALKAALPTLKNVEVTIAAGAFKIPNDKARPAADALKPFATNITVSVTDDSVDAEVKKAEDRLSKSLEGLEARINAKSGKLTAKMMNIAADILDTL